MQLIWSTTFDFQLEMFLEQTILISLVYSLITYLHLSLSSVIHIYDTQYVYVFGPEKTVGSET